MGHFDDALLATAASILLRYTRAPVGRNCQLQVTVDGEQREFSRVNTFEDKDIDPYRIGAS